MLIDGKRFFDTPIKNDQKKTYEQNYWNGEKQWLHGRQFIELWVLFKTLKINWHRFKLPNWIRKPWFKTTH